MFHIWLIKRLISMSFIRIYTLCEIRWTNWNFFLSDYTVRPEVIVICETWLSESLTAFCNVEGYRAVHNCRSAGYAGLTVFVREDVQCEITCNEKLE
jgi:ABC-type uncharacterized transport system permease subunit